MARHFVDEQFHEALSADPGKKAFGVGISGNEVREISLPVRYL
jgi:hypothetical protein